MSDSRSASPTILFVHGFLDDHTAWRDVRADLEPDLSTVALDLPGCGALADSHSVTLAGMSDAVVAELDRADGPVVLVGQSMGAQVGELAAAARPDWVVALVLITPVPLAGTHLEGDEAEVFRSLGGNAEAQRQARLSVSVALDERALDMLVASGSAPRPETVAQAFEAWNGGHPAGAHPSTYRGPVWILKGADDPFVTQELLDAGVLPRFPDAQLRVIDHSGHFPHMEAPAEVASTLREVVASVDRLEV
ncbi:alpha/beta hydrolase [Pseudonocardia sp. NPDC049154]|uniref:alpha/beta fold hydrolase n=1 Tax=Pseudonocardia sp. NPDC049154 TaxID=3155501 RepID=UPI0033D3FA89